MKVWNCPRVLSWPEDHVLPKRVISEVLASSFLAEASPCHHLSTGTWRVGHKVKRGTGCIRFNRKRSSKN